MHRKRDDKRMTVEWKRANPLKWYKYWYGHGKNWMGSEKSRLDVELDNWWGNNVSPFVHLMDCKEGGNIICFRHVCIYPLCKKEIIRQKQIWPDPEM
jgi:hypothetical protein